MRKRKLLPALLICFICGMFSSRALAEQAPKPVIVTTTSIIADTVRNIVGDAATVESLMGPGVDPHLYKASFGDLGRLNAASLVVSNGLHLEGKMAEVLTQLGKRKPVLELGTKIDPARIRFPTGSETAPDPHFWFDVSLWASTLPAIEQSVLKILPNQEQTLSAARSAFAKELNELDTWCRTQILTIPQNQRILITAHDAFGYFGAAYGIEVRGLQGISTAAEFGIRDLTDLADFIVARRVPAVFIETSVSERSIEALRANVTGRGIALRLGGSLYSDALGAADSPSGTYVGMVRANVSTIVEALR